MTKSIESAARWSLGMEFSAALAELRTNSMAIPIHTVPEIAVEITVRPLSGRATTIEVSSKTTLLSAKQVAARALGFAPTNAMQLVGPNGPLKEYFILSEISANSTLTLVVVQTRQLWLAGFPRTATVQDILAVCALHDVADRIAHAEQAVQIVEYATTQRAAEGMREVYSALGHGRVAVIQLRDSDDAAVVQEALCNQSVCGQSGDIGHLQVYLPGAEVDRVVLDECVCNPGAEVVGVPAAQRRDQGFRLVLAAMEEVRPGARWYPGIQALALTAG